MRRARTSQTTIVPRPSLVGEFHALARESARAACKQERTARQFEELSYGLIGNLGRQTLTQTLRTLGNRPQGWGAAYDLFHQPRIAVEPLRRTLFGQVLDSMGRRRPVVSVLDGTKVPRTGKRMPGVGWTKALTSPPWKPGLQRAQRWEGLSLLLPRSDKGETRALPLWFEPAPTPTATAWPDHPPRTEWRAGLDALEWLRGQLDDAGQRQRELLVIADGSYAVAPLLRDLPPHTTLLARCAKNRALFALPSPPPPGHRGRRPAYGAQGPRPQELLHARTPPWRRARVTIRRRKIPLTYRVAGPFLIKPAPKQPVFVLVVKGIEQTRHGRVLRRDPTYWLVSATRRGEQWVLPRSPQQLLAWAWQRWEVEVMHRELKSGFGLGQHQAWNPDAAALTTQWVVWCYATMLLSGYRCWGWAHDPTNAPWGRPRRWTPRDVVTEIRRELWGELGAAIRASLSVMTDNCHEMARSRCPPSPAELAYARRL